MNDSLLDELENEDSTPYSPLLASVHETTSSLNSSSSAYQTTHQYQHQAPASSSFKDKFIATVQTVTPSTSSLRKTTLPSPGFHLFTSSSKSSLPDASGYIEDLDGFCISLYNYFLQKGQQNMIIAGLVSVVNLLFTILLSSFLLGCVQWNTLANCNVSYENGTSTTSECNKPLIDFISCSPNGSLFQIMILFYFCLFFTFWVGTTLSFIKTVKDTMEMEDFYSTKLGIKNRTLQMMEWKDVVNKIKELKLYSNMGGNHSSTELNEHAIASRIMRRENYMIAFLNMNVLNLGIQLPFMQERASRVFFARNMEFNLHVCILNHMFDDNYHLKDGFLQDVAALQKRFLVAGVMNFFMIPFVLLFMIVHFFLKYTQEWHTRRNYLGPRQWSPLALWRFREFNELPHIFDERIASSYPIAQRYQNIFPSSALSMVARCFTFISGSLIAVLLVLSLVEEAILLETHLMNRQLIWYATVLAGVYAMSRSFVPDPEKKQTKWEKTSGTGGGGMCMTDDCDAEEIMLQLSAKTHYFPIHWKNNCNSFDVRDDFFELFQYKIQLFFQELVSVALTPYLLITSLPGSAANILAFVDQHTVQDRTLGAVCRYSLFDFKRYGNGKYGCSQGSNIGEASLQGKMEKSYINFKEHHPDWVHNDQEGDAMMARVEEFKMQHESILLEQSMASLSARNSNRMFPGFGASVVLPEESSVVLPEITQDKDASTLPSNDASAMGLNSMFLGGSMTSSQLMQSTAIQAALGHESENKFYWMEKYHQSNLDQNIDNHSSSSDASRDHL